MAIPATKAPLQLTLIVATTPSLGIGLNGTLPWPAIKADMSYFARVTKRAIGQTLVKNVVVMGRKTWDSIPIKFRPLKGRTNLVITSQENWSSGIPEGKSEDEVLRAGSLQSALELLAKREEEDIGRVFVIGGSSVYKTALDMRETKRILLTKIGKEYECDTQFPVDLEGEEGEQEGWKRRNVQELEEFISEGVGDGHGIDGDVPYEFCMWERD